MIAGNIYPNQMSWISPMVEDINSVCPCISNLSVVYLTGSV